MKRRTLRGQLIEGQVKRLIVDDGRLNHGYKVIRFIVSGIPDSSGNDTYATLSLDYDAPFTWDWSDNRQIAWSSSGVSAVGDVRGPWELVDPDHVVIRDLYVQGRVSGSGGGSVVNYFVELEYVELTDDQAVLTLIKERSQDDWK